MSPKTLKTPIEQDVCTQYVSFLSNRYANKHYSISTDQTLRLNASQVRLVMNVWLCTYALVKRLDPAGFLPDLESLLTGAFLPPCPILALDWFKPGTVCSSFGSADDVFRSSRSPQSSVFFFFKHAFWAVWSRPCFARRLNFEVFRACNVVVILSSICFFLFYFKCMFVWFFFGRLIMGECVFKRFYKALGRLSSLSRTSFFH